MGYSTCRFFCGKKWRSRGMSLSTRLLGSDELTDGEWIWPEGLPHYIEAHYVCLPEEFVARMELHGWRVPDNPGIRHSRARSRITVKPKLIGYWAPIPWCEPPPSWWHEPPGESPWPDITRFV